MKVLLVAPQSPIFPVGIAYISAALKQAGHHVDCCIFSTPSNLIERLLEKYDLLATGGLSSQFAQLKNITNIARNTNTKVICGGGIITSEPEVMSRALNVDYAVIGEGEETVVKLLKSLESKGDLGKVEGVGYFKNGEFVLTHSWAPIMNLDSVAWPDYESFGFRQLLDSAKPNDMYYLDIFDHPREYPLIASRSCPFQCTFCYHPLGNKYRQRSVDSIMEELEWAIPKYRINIVSIQDELFSYSRERVNEFCRRFKAFMETLSWQVRWLCQMRVDKLDEALLETMRDSGCFMVSYGFESYSPIVLKSMKKHISPEQIHHAIHATMDKGISIQGNFIFGDKAETLQTAKETLHFWKGHPEAGIALFFIFACPDSEMYQIGIKKGVIKDKIDFIANHLFDPLNLTEMPERDFVRLRTLVIEYLTKYQIRCVPIKRTSTSITVRCPHCQGVTQYSNYATPAWFYFRALYCRKCRRRFFAVSRLFAIYAKLKLIVLTITPSAYWIGWKLRQYLKIWRAL